MLRRGVFDDVLQETLLATYRRGEAAGPVAVHQLYLVNGIGLAIADAGTIALPADPSQPWLLPRDPLQTPLVKRLAGMIGGMPSALALWSGTASRTSSPISQAATAGR